MNLSFFLKSTRPSLPLKKAPPLSPSPFPLRVQGMYQPPYSVLKPLRYKVGGPSEVYASSGAAVFCAGMNPPSLKDLLRGCLLVAFFENLPVLLLLIKRAALGNLKANFHCAHLHNLSLQGTGDVPTALSIVFTTPSVPLVGDRNGAQTATLYGWRTIRGLRQFFVRDGGLQGQDLLKNGCVGCDHRDKMDGALRNLLILSSYSS